MRPLRWEPPLYAEGGEEIAEDEGRRYRVARVAKGARTWIARVQGERIGLYPSKGLAKAACDAKAEELAVVSPQSRGTMP